MSKSKKEKFPVKSIIGNLKKKENTLINKEQIQINYFLLSNSRRDRDNVIKTRSRKQMLNEIIKLIQKNYVEKPI